MICLNGGAGRNNRPSQRSRSLPHRPSRVARREMHQLLFEFCKGIRVTPNQPVLSLAAVAPIARGAVEALVPTLLVRPLRCHGETDLHALAQVLAGAIGLTTIFSGITQFCATNPPPSLINVFIPSAPHHQQCSGAPLSLASFHTANTDNRACCGRRSPAGPRGARRSSSCVV